MHLEPKIECLLPECFKIRLTMNQFINQKFDKR